MSLLRVSRHFLYSDHVVLPEQGPWARSRLEGAKRRPRTHSKRETWVAEEAEENMSQEVGSTQVFLPVSLNKVRTLVWPRGDVLLTAFMGKAGCVRLPGHVLEQSPK